MQRALIALVLFLTACASVQPRNVEVAVEELRAQRWRVRYSLEAPVREVVFERARGRFREAKWQIVEPAGARWGAVGTDGMERIAFSAPTSRFVLEMATDVTLLEKDYRQNIPFSDGSLLLYTGHLRLDGFPNHFVFRSDRSVRVPSQEDTYVYFGSIEPVETERMTLIVDPGLPPWIARQLRERVPAMFDYFAAKMGTELGFKPLALVSYGGDEGSGMSFAGGTLKGIVQIDFKGPGWSKETPKASQQWFRHVSHEVFHLWESQRFTNGAEWLGEASAEYASVTAMRDLGVIDERAQHRLVVDAANQCIADLGDGSLASAVERGRFRTVYSCGLVSQWLIGDAWPVYRRTFNRPRAWVTADFIDALRAIPGDRAAVEQLVTGKTEDTGAFLESALRRTGIRVKLVEEKLQLE